MEEPALAQVLKILSHIGHPVMVAAFAFVIAASVFALLLHAKRPVIASIAAAGIIILGVTPYAASARLQSRGIYQIGRAHV
jgi:hypothetical protein